MTQGNEDKLRPVPHRLVITHPVTGRKSLYLSSHIGGIVGWPVPEARAFIRDLTEHATQPQFVYAHAWRVNDLVMWDNRTVMHRARRFDDLKEVRDLRRTSIKGTGLAVEPVPAHGRGVSAMTISDPPARIRCSRARCPASTSRGRSRATRSRRSRPAWIATPSWCSAISA